MLEHHRIVLMFSGQGSQYYQMGQAFFDGDARFRNTLLELDAIAKHSVGHSIVDVLYDKRRKKEEPFEAIKSTSAAIFMIEYALVRVLLDDGLKPDYLLAASMGLYAAAATAGALDPRDVLECISKASAVYEAHCPRGAMIAIFGSPTLHRDLRVLHECSDIAAVNFDSHFVISTIQRHVSEITATLDRNGVTFQTIPVSYPFHSRWLNDVSDAAKAVLGTLRCRQPKIPIICCSRAAVIDGVSPATIWNAIRKPIQFRQTIASLEAHGPCCYVDVGPAGTLATFLKYSLPPTSASRTFSILSPFAADLKNYQRLIAARELFADRSVSEI